MISRWRGINISNHATGHFSSASGSRVWLVYARVLCVRSQAWSHPSCASSSRMRINSGTAMDGCVSLSWIATFSGSAVPIGIAAPETPDQIGQRAGDQEILLHEAQALPMAGRIIGIQHPRQRFGSECLGQRADEIAAAELLKIEVIRRGRGPQPKRVDGLAAVSDDRTIIWNADQTGGLARHRRAGFRR